MIPCEKLMVKQKNANTVGRVEMEGTKDMKEKLNKQVARLEERRPSLKKSTPPPLSANSGETTPYMTRHSRNRGNLQVDAPSQALEINIPNIKAVQSAQMVSVQASSSM